MNVTTMDSGNDELDIECGKTDIKNRDDGFRNRSSDLSEVQQFFENKNILISGATGFLGKVLTQKLLTCCSNLKKLYILVRMKHGKDINTRIDELFEDLIFDRLKKEVPDFRCRVVGVEGDCAAVDLGLTVSDRVMLQENINVIFHSAATVKFNEHIRLALAINVRATLLLLDIAKELRHIECFMQISTAFSNAFLNCIDEKFYPTNVVYEELQKKIDGLTDEEIEEELHELIDSKWPNTYTFTKALTESELMRRCERVPLCILRPSIVTSTAKEPFKGWVNNMHRPIGLVASCATGILRTLPCDSSATAEIVPVDYMVKCLLVTSLNVHRLYSHSPPPSEPPIYNFVTTPTNRLTWQTFKSSSLKKIHIYPSSRAVWYKVLVLNKNWYMQQICVLLLHLLPALLMDGLAVCLRKRPRKLKICGKLKNFSAAITYFTTKNFNFKNNRTQELWKGTSDLDKELFPFDMRTFDWDDYFEDILLGVRRYLLKESDETLPRARIKWMRLYYLHQIVRIILCFGALSAIIASVASIMNVIDIFKSF